MKAVFFIAFVSAPSFDPVATLESRDERPHRFLASFGLVDIDRPLLGLGLPLKYQHITSSRPGILAS
jgi:hypothetical protein